MGNRQVNAGRWCTVEVHSPTVSEPVAIGEERTAEMVTIENTRNVER